MFIVGITGSIGSGKTTIAQIIKKFGFVVFDIDNWVKQNYYNQSFLQVLNRCFEGIVKDKFVDKRALRNIIFNDDIKRKKLEDLIHPFLEQKIKKAIRKNAKFDGMFFIDAPLLFENGWDKYCNAIIVADASLNERRKRVVIRDNVSCDDFDKINKIQIDNEIKKILADVVIDTEKNKNLLNADIAVIIKMLGNLK